MAEPKNQHYIPQSYLRNFSFDKNREQVYVRFRGEKFHPTNIRNICSENYFYTIPGADEETKNNIEKFYAEGIDSYFPEITAVLTDDSVKKIDQALREKILYAALSLHFRTPRMYNYHKKHVEDLISLCKAYRLGKTEVHTINFLGRRIDVKNINVEMVEAKQPELQKLVFLNEHIKIFQEFVRYKLNDGIGVIKTVTDDDFITCDNPLLMHNYKTSGFNNLFDPENYINLPITPKYLLAIHPKTDVSVQNGFTRINGQLTNVLTTNHEIDTNSDQWIIGSENTVKKHLDNQTKYNEDTAENRKMVEDLKEKALLIQELYGNGILDENGHVKESVIVKMKEISKRDVFKNDPNIIRQISLLREKGYDI